MNCSKERVKTVSIVVLVLIVAVQLLWGIRTQIELSIGVGTVKAFRSIVEGKIGQEERLSSLAEHYPAGTRLKSGSFVDQLVEESRAIAEIAVKRECALQ